MNRLGHSIMTAGITTGDATTIDVRKLGKSPISSAWKLLALAFGMYFVGFFVAKGMSAGRSKSALGVVREGIGQVPVVGGLIAPENPASGKNLSA